MLCYTRPCLCICLCFVLDTLRLFLLLFFWPLPSPSPCLVSPCPPNFFSSFFHDVLPLCFSPCLCLILVLLCLSPFLSYHCVVLSFCFSLVWSLSLYLVIMFLCLPPCPCIILFLPGLAFVPSSCLVWCFSPRRCLCLLSCPCLKWSGLAPVLSCLVLLLSALVSSCHGLDLSLFFVCALSCLNINLNVSLV